MWALHLILILFSFFTIDNSSPLKCVHVSFAFNNYFLSVLSHWWLNLNSHCLQLRTLTLLVCSCLLWHSTIIFSPVRPWMVRWRTKLRSALYSVMEKNAFGCVWLFFSFLKPTTGRHYDCVCTSLFQCKLFRAQPGLGYDWYSVLLFQLYCGNFVSAITAL